MSYTKLKNGNYQARFQHAGKRYKRNFDTARKAKAWEADTLAKLEKGETIVRTKDTRTLKELVQAWYDFHGHSLKTGADRLLDLKKACDDMGNPYARTFSSRTFAEYRVMRLEQGITANTINHMHAYLLAVFNELLRLNEWQGENPLIKLKKLKVDERELTFLDEHQIDALLRQCEASRNAQLATVVRLCLSTGCRWGEALSLNWSSVQSDRVTYTGTKSGKNRTIPISGEIYDELKLKGFRNGPLFDSEMRVAFEQALERAKIELPAGQNTHVLRHSFASHFVMNGGDLLTLQKILGHSSLDMVLRYAHLAPDHLEKAILFNPISKKNGPKVAHLPKSAPKKSLELVENK